MKFLAVIKEPRVIFLLLLSFNCSGIFTQTENKTYHSSVNVKTGFMNESFVSFGFEQIIYTADKFRLALDGLYGWYYRKRPIFCFELFEGSPSCEITEYKVSLLSSNLCFIIGNSPVKILVRGGVMYHKEKSTGVWNTIVPSGLLGIRVGENSERGYFIFGMGYPSIINIGLGINAF